MDRGAAVHRHVGDGPAPQQLDEQRRQSHFDDVPAEHREHAAAAGRRDDCVGDEAQIARGEDVGE